MKLNFDRKMAVVVPESAAEHLALGRLVERAKIAGRRFQLCRQTDDTVHLRFPRAEIADWMLA